MLTISGIKQSGINILLRHGFRDVDLLNPYEVRRLKGDCTVILYSTGKVLMMGEDSDVENAKKILSNSGDSDESFRPQVTEKGAVQIGSDECLKGDTFGGIVVAAVKADDTLREKLLSIGVKDSKKLTDPAIIRMAEKMLAFLGDKNYSVEQKTPSVYNMYPSQTSLLNQMHSRAISALLPADSIVVDQYPGCAISLDKVKTTTSAESKYIEVAAASVLARYFGLKQINDLSRKAGFRLPLGSTHVKEALRLMKEKKLNMNDFAKIRFRNVKEFL